MLDHVRSDSKNRGRTTMFVLGVSMTVTGGLTVSGPSDVGIGPWLGTALLACGLFVVGTVVWGRS